MKNNLNLLFKNFADFIPDKLVKPLINLVGGERIIDLLFFVPKSYANRTTLIQNAKVGDYITFVGKVVKHIAPSGGRRIYRVVMCNDTSSLELIFFHYKHVSSVYPKDSLLTVSGKVVSFGKSIAISHPDKVLKGEMFNEVSRIDPIYRCTAVQRGVFSSAIKTILIYLDDFQDWITEDCKIKYNWPSFIDGIRGIHGISSAYKLSQCWQRLAFDELISRALLLRSYKPNIAKSSVVNRLTTFRELLMKNVMFSLTSDQEDVVEDILDDQVALDCKVRLLQGDVGSGKTVVAAIAMANIVENKLQAVFLAPTEVLADQHYVTITKMFAGMNVKICLLKSKIKQSEKKIIIGGIANGEYDIVIGTHALLQSNIQFHRLAFVVVDEQQRFGVAQRMLLMNKGNGDLLLMSATPIPRTLKQVLYGSIDVSTITQKPKERKKIITTLISSKNIEELLQKVKNAVNNGSQVYWVCPLIDSNDEQTASLMSRYTILQKIIPNNVEFIHGKLKNKDEIMRNFLSGEIRVLVSTTVIEVGVDVPNANIMIIENPESFGLSQLHQLRGRVGRGTEQSYCILLYGESLTNIAKQRLQVIKEFDDGFYIAEKDYELRGSGDIAGYKQSGFAEFRFFDEIRDRWMNDMIRTKKWNFFNCSEEDIVIKLFHTEESILSN